MLVECFGLTLPPKKGKLSQKKKRVVAKKRKF